MNTQRLITITAAAIALTATSLTLPACQSMGGGGTGGSLTDILTNLTGDWDLSSIAGTDISQLLPQGLKVPSLNFGADGKVSGFTGVNRLASSLDLEKLAAGGFSINPAAVTRMAGPPEAMNVENKFLEALNNADGFKLKDNALSLTDNGTELAKFLKR